MQIRIKYYIIFTAIIFLTSCSVLEKSSRHGFESGYYHYKSAQANNKKVYLDITDESINIYENIDDNSVNQSVRRIELSDSDSLYHYPEVFGKKSLDIDLTTILLKYRPSVYDLPAQLTTDLNFALYAGWRHDNYRIQSTRDPLNKCHYEILSRGYDFGLFAGTGTTLIGPFSTQNSISDEYSGMILECGLAGFLESSFASFGLSFGFDFLLNSDREVWIYEKKPWVGFVIGIALN